MKSLEVALKIRHLVRQVNGQRIYRPNWNNGDVLIPEGYEIFVCHLPKDAFEGELIPVFAGLGEIFEVRLMMDFSGLTRGFCFVTYRTKYMAKRAVRYLHGYKIRPTGETIACYLSYNNRRLHLKGIPKNEDFSDIEKAIISKIPGIYKVIPNNDAQKDPQFGSCFVEFLNHKFAVTCRKAYWPANLFILGARVTVEWAIPIPPEQKNSILLINHVPRRLTRGALLTRIESIISIKHNILNAFKRHRYAILRFLYQKHALGAYKVLKNHPLGASVLSVKLFDFNNKGENMLLTELRKYSRGNILPPFTIFADRDICLPGAYA
ncbi:hypothetical protein Trydic_g15430 [Trypoxylus dichotomus]